jgi:hypothetical protein
MTGFTLNTLVGTQTASLQKPGLCISPDRSVEGVSSQALSFCCVRSLTYELIVVDDGSRDKTVDVVKGYSRRLGSDTIRLLKLPKNRGKGGALKEVSVFFSVLVLKSSSFTRIQTCRC